MGAIAIMAGYSAAAEPAVSSPSSRPFLSGLQMPAIGARSASTSLPSSSGQRYAQGRFPRCGHPVDMVHGKIKPDTAGVSTVPHWSDSFTYNGLVYKYTMVGTDPKTSSATTVIPTVLIPLRFVLADGNVFDATTDIVNGQTPIQGIINSPIFQNYNFNNTSAKVGNTQFGDAFQRANFWNSVSTKSPNYHVILGQPRVAPAQTINVPYGSFFYYDDPVTGPQPIVDLDSLLDYNQILNGAGVSPDGLAIIVWGQVTSFYSEGFHNVTSLNGRDLQTFIATSYLPGSFFDFPDVNISGVFFSDVYVLSHEIAEWMDDPFPYANTNFTPGWDHAIPFPGETTPPVRCNSSPYDFLEVADPLENFVQSDVPLPATSYTYHVADTVFIDWFTRATKSRSYNGQYAMFEVGFAVPFFNKAIPPTPVCTGHVEFTPTYVEFPGAAFTVVNGINNKGLAVGTYFDASFFPHGFVFDGSTYSTLDYPGALGTNPQKINDTGMIVGTYNTGSTTRGFSYSKGHWTSIDFPGASDTEVYGINSSGALVGIYDGLQPITHAFLFQNGKYQDIPNPFGTQTNAFAINDVGSITGLGYTNPDPFVAPLTSFILSSKSFTTFQFPGSILSQLSTINNGNDLGGIFIDPDGELWGLVTVNGIPYQVNAAVNGNNDLQQICGYTFNPNIGRFGGVIGTLPLQKTAH